MCITESLCSIADWHNIVNQLLCSVTSVMSDSLGPYGCIPPNSSVHEILQARILEWGSMTLSRGSSLSRD